MKFIKVEALRGNINDVSDYLQLISKKNPNALKDEVGGMKDYEFLINDALEMGVTPNQIKQAIIDSDYIDDFAKKMYDLSDKEKYKLKYAESYNIFESKIKDYFFDRANKVKQELEEVINEIDDLNKEYDRKDDQGQPTSEISNRLEELERKKVNLEKEIKLLIARGFIKEDLTVDDLVESLGRNEMKFLKENKTLLESSNDGWKEDVLDFDVWDTLDGLLYELRNCVKGSYTNCNTYEDLAGYIVKLSEDMADAANDIKYMHDDPDDEEDEDLDEATEILKDPIASKDAFNHAMTMNEDAFDFTVKDEDTFDELLNSIHYNGADYRRARVPGAVRTKINQINIPDGMRLKSFDVTNESDNEGLVGRVIYITQEDFNKNDAQVFAKEFKRVLSELKKDKGFNKPAIILLTVESRDGATYGHYEEEIDLQNLSESLKEAADDVSDNSLYIGSAEIMDDDTMNVIGNATLHVTPNNKILVGDQVDSYVVDNLDEVRKELSYRYGDEVDRIFISFNLEHNLQEDSTITYDVVKELENKPQEENDLQLAFNIHKDELVDSYNNAFEQTQDQNISAQQAALDVMDKFELSSDKDIEEITQYALNAIKGFNIKDALEQLDKENNTNLENMYEGVELNKEEKEKLASLVAKKLVNEAYNFLYNKMRGNK